MRQYEDALMAIRRFGKNRDTRAGKCRTMFGQIMVFDLMAGFPLVTTKEVNFNLVKAELLGFLRAFDSAAQFRELGAKIWDANANSETFWLNNPMRKGEDDLGAIYGVQWRKWKDTIVIDAARAGWATSLGYTYQGRIEGSEEEVWIREVDQVADLINRIRTTPQDRRMIVSAWNPAQLHQMALPPCHIFWQCFVQDGLLHMQMYQRSADWFLGVPFNIASYALLLAMLAQVTGLEPGQLNMVFGDAHYYLDHEAQVEELLSRDPRLYPTLSLNKSVTDIDVFQMDDIQISEYHPHPPIRAAMNV